MEDGVWEVRAVKGELSLLQLLLVVQNSQIYILLIAFPQPCQSSHG